MKGRGCAFAYLVVLLVCNWFLSLPFILPSLIFSSLPSLPPFPPSLHPSLFFSFPPSFSFYPLFLHLSSSTLSSSPPSFSLSRSPSTDRSDLETSFSHNHAYLRDVASLDINSSEFGSLPAEVQHELLLERQQMEKYSYNDPATLPQVHERIIHLYTCSFEACSELSCHSIYTLQLLFHS